MVIFSKLKFTHLSSLMNNNNCNEYLIQPEVWMCEPVTDKNKLMNDDSFRAKMEKLSMQIQGELCRKMEEIDGTAKFFVDKWDRKAGGGGITCVMSDGDVFEKAGVNISAIHGKLTKQAIMQMKARLTDLNEELEYVFFACGISSVIHPKNPHVAACHFNFRYFEMEKPDGKTIWWYGGGSDLTPNFLVPEDAVHFHRTLKTACDKHDPTFYPNYKAWCDRYFFIAHRNERRGVGGIFFDDHDLHGQMASFQFVESCAHSIIPAYLPLVERNMNVAYSENDRDWQLIRRGRYVEFNLVYDRGTKFGLATPEARIESILMSLPLVAKWVYSHQPDDDERKTELISVLQNPREWL